MKFQKTYSFDVSQARTDIFFNLTRWNWENNNDNSSLAMMLGFYALNITTIQGLGFPLQDYIVQDYNFFPPEGLEAKYSPFDPSAFLLSGMNLTASNGANTPGGFFSLKSNETMLSPPVYEQKLNYVLPSGSSSKMPLVRLQFEGGNTTLPGYFSFPGFALGLDSNGAVKDTLNVTASYVSTGNYLRLFLAYPYFSTDQLRSFFSVGVDDSYLPAPPSPEGVYLVLPSISGTEALIIGGLGILSIVVAVYATRIVHREDIETK